jgi:hypothetical protein
MVLGYLLYLPYIIIDFVLGLFGVSWKKINKPPKWVKKTENRIAEKYLKKYGIYPDKRAYYLKGKTYRYKIWFERFLQGGTKTIFYRRKRWNV